MKFIVLFIVAGFTVLSACCRSAADGTQKSEEGIGDTSIVGVVYASGNEPFVRLRIDAGDNKNFEMRADSLLYRALWQMQGRRVRVSGKTELSPLGMVLRAKSFHVVQ